MPKKKAKQKATDWRDKYTKMSVPQLEAERDAIAEKLSSGSEPMVFKKFLHIRQLLSEK